MNRTVISFVVLIGAIAVAVYFFVLKEQPKVVGGGGAAVTGEIPEAMKAAIAFCKEKGNTVETVTAAEGRTDLCVLKDGKKIEVSKFMADNKTE